MTYRGETRTDFILASPALHRFWHKFECLPDTVSDHAQLELYLDLPGNLPKVVRWKTCRDSEVVFKQARNNGWDPVDPSWHDLRRHDGDVEFSYRTFVNNFEQYVTEAYKFCGGLLPLHSFFGRACPKKILQTLHAPVVRKPRHGEHVPTVDDAPTNCGSKSDNVVVCPLCSIS